MVFLIMFPLCYTLNYVWTPAFSMLLFPLRHCASHIKNWALFNVGKPPKIESETNDLYNILRTLNVLIIFKVLF